MTPDFRTSTADEHGWDSLPHAYSDGRSSFDEHSMYVEALQRDHFQQRGDLSAKHTSLKAVSTLSGFTISQTNDPYFLKPSLINASGQSLPDDYILGLRVWLRQTEASMDPIITECLNDLRQVIDEAEEENYPIPTSLAIENGERILRVMYQIYPRRYEVYPTPDGHVAIDAPDGNGRSIMVICSSDGGAMCMVNFGNGDRRARYSSASQLPDEFLAESLRDLEAGVDD